MLLGGSGLFREEGPNGETLDIGDYILRGDPGTLTSQTFLLCDLPVLPCHRVSTAGPINHGEAVSQIEHLRFFPIILENLANTSLPWL